MSHWKEDERGAWNRSDGARVVNISPDRSRGWVAWFRGGVELTGNAIGARETTFRALRFGSAQTAMAAVDRGAPLPAVAPSVTVTAEPPFKSVSPFTVREEWSDEWSDALGPEPGPRRSFLRLSGKRGDQRE